MNWWKLLQHPQLIVLAIAIIAPIVKAIFKNLSEQSAKRKRLIEQEKAQIEALRTGQSVGSGTTGQQTTAKDELADMAASRRLERMDTGGPGASPPLPTSVRGSSAGTALPQRSQNKAGPVRPQARTDRSPRSANVMKPQAMPRQQRKPTPPPVPQSKGTANGGGVNASPPPVQTQPQPAAVVTRPAATGAAASGVLLSQTLRSGARTELRRAVMMQEVLGPPVALRTEPGQLNRNL
jgi:FtsZ-interacting cell division protein ZipA